LLGFEETKRDASPTTLSSKPHADLTQPLSWPERESRPGSVALRHENEEVPTAISLSDRVQIELLTADEFLDWLKPEVHADLIDGEKTMHTPVWILDPETLAHRFYAREGVIPVEFAKGDPRIRSRRRGDGS
jgi:hypothetical protein